MAESVVSFVVEKIGELLIQEAFFLAGVSGQVRQMQDELRRMQCFLEDADKRQDEHKLVRGWVSDIRELAYDAENIIETFVLEIASRREEGFLKKMYRYATICIEFAKIHKLGNEIKAIEGRITSLTTSLTTYGIQFKNEPQSSSTLLQQKLKRTYSHLVEEHTIGLDSDVKNLVTKLRGEGIDVVSICGMGGIGKTTLANKLYHHVSVRDHFNVFAWCCVSQQFQPRQVWEGILFKLVTPSKERRDEISKMNDDEIAKELFLLQTNKKCLVVLDDIWTEDAWDVLKPAFPIGKAVGGSKIVLTTRNKTLASYADGRAFIHELQTLNEDDSWELFQTKAFQNNINSDACHSVISRKISAMAEPVVSFAVERIGDLLIGEALFLAGVSDQVRQMQTEFQRMQRFLKDADKRQDKEELVRGWVSEIKDLAYDAENVIESFALRVASRREKGFRNKCKRYATIFIEGAHAHKVGKEIAAIQARITSLTTSLTTYGIQFKNEPQGSSTSLQQKLKRTYSHLVEEHTIGLDNDVKILVAKLRDEETGVVSICGMGGLGKSTLARKVYHHVSVRDHFDAFAWYCVSQQFQPRLVWEGILFKLVSPSKERREEISKMNDDEIAKELYLLQQRMKCLVVLDDIWEKNAWSLLKAAFPIGEAGGSKIILTSRNKTLGRHADPNAFIHELQTLNEHDSWELFLTKAFPKNINSGFKSNMDMDTTKLGKKIVEKCAGLPLAIILLGGLLGTKHSVTEWDKVHKNFDLFLKRDTGTDQEYSDVYWVLALSYNELPYQLKPCFLHLGHFPEDYDIPCKTLIRMWVAEGFVSIDGARNEIMEDVAERYLDGLIYRSIVEVSNIGSIGKPKTCRLHDLMRDFCLSKAHQENYLEIVHTTISKEKTNSNRVHRLAVHRHDIDLGYYARTPYLRSFLFILPKMHFLSEISLNYFKFLKIMSLKNCRVGKKMGIEIGSLIHLRYLAIEDCLINDPLSSIGNLRYLQTLSIRCQIRLPNVVWKLEQLRHFVLTNCVLDDESLKLGNMRELQTLTLECDLKKWDIGVLVNSPNLRKIELRIDLGVDEIPSVVLSRLSSLSIRDLMRFPSIGSKEEGLKILFSSCHQLLNLSYIGKIQEKLPEWQHFPPNLTKLRLEDCYLDEDPMPILEKLPNLRILRLQWDSFVGTLLVCSSKGFPKLQALHLIGLSGLEEWRVAEEAMPNLSHLHIENCRRLSEWRVEEEAMPNLSHLHIENCFNLKMMPEGIKFITTLRHLQIEYMPKAFSDRVVRGGDDFYKAQHVPHIIIR